ncbi:hypothetical protein D9619_004707 [Psilocybe cf. subviscida]|uniref:Uncharacterized protein n=1 Tax=Psilocybe cf. subviscida TaxID=2480587 RepID=A0A8H5BPJ2_9AGAR|nr:hypothetical protein D9619_004707 [Psilocybe cf. subviscida]
MSSTPGLVRQLPTAFADTNRIVRESFSSLSSTSPQWHPVLIAPSKITFENTSARRLASATQKTIRKFFELLGIENDSDSKLTVRKVVNDAISSHLDVEKCGSEQMKNLIRLEQEVKSFPRLIRTDSTEFKCKVTEKPLVAVRYGTNGLAHLSPGNVSAWQATATFSGCKESQTKVADIADPTRPAEHSDDEVFIDTNASPSSSNADSTEKSLIGCPKSGDINERPIQATKNSVLHRDIQSLKENMQTQTPARTDASHRGESASQRSTSRYPYRHSIKTATPLQPINSNQDCHPQGPVEKITDSESRPAQALHAWITPTGRQFTNKAQDDTSISAIKDFLSSCDPPMEHLLPLFTKAGCISGDYLQSIAKRSPEERESILRKILELKPASRRQTHDHSGVPASACDIDVWLLDLHLVSYTFEVVD